MKRIYENTCVRTLRRCHECGTLFDYQDEDVNVEKTEWDERSPWYGDNHHFKTKETVTCPKCGKELHISTYAYSV